MNMEGDENCKSMKLIGEKFGELHGRTSKYLIQERMKCRSHPEGTARRKDCDAYIKRVETLNDGLAGSLTRFLETFRKECT